MRLRLFACAAALLGMVAGGFGLAPHAAAACNNKKAPVVTDAEGDATGFFVADLVFPNEPSLDVIEGRLKFDKKKQRMVFTVEVAGMTATPPPASEGKYFRFQFSFQGGTYQVGGFSDDVLGTEHFALSILEDVSFTTIDSSITGSFNVGKNTVSMDLPFKTFNAAAKAYFAEQGQPGPKAMKKGSTLGGFSITGQRFIGPRAVGPAPGAGSVTPTADEAEGECIYVIGKGVTG